MKKLNNGLQRDGVARLLAPLALGLMAASTAAQEPFEQCRARLSALAIDRGISEAVATMVMADVKPLERVISADRNQPEFIQSFDQYLGIRVTADRIATGRELYARHRPLLDRLAETHGVPGQYLVAFWGLESNFGRYLGDIPVFDSLTTLACDQRRSAYFTDELINAMAIVERGDAEPDEMVGSWAGAMGQTQFMPSVYLQHAVDGDGDGRANLWLSAEDALSSAARYLGSMGWESGFRWGREVLLPDDFDFSVAGRDQPRSLSQWRELGVSDVSGESVSALAIDAALLVPAGSDGPAFLVYDNFDAIMRWNRSESFAISIGHLADRIAGAGGLSRPPPAGEQLTRDQLQAIQIALTENGFDAGPADGVPGSATRAAIRAYQASRSLVADGFADPDLLAELGLE